MSFETVSPRSIHDRLAAGESIALIDVRSPAEFRAVHATGARNVPLDRLDPATLNAGPVAFVCQSGARSQQAATKAVAAGVATIYSIDGGTAAWEKAGLSVDRSASAGPISMERQVRIAAGALVFFGVLLAWTVHPAFATLPLFVGGGLVFSGVTNTCGMARALALMPWNR